jgi:hypothetical protein
MYSYDNGYWVDIAYQSTMEIGTSGFEFDYISKTNTQRHKQDHSYPNSSGEALNPLDFLC